jgi:hypothetical protein
MPAPRKDQQIRDAVRDYLDRAVESPAEAMPINKRVLARVAHTTRTTLSKWISAEEIEQAMKRQRENQKLSPAQKERRALEDLLQDRSREIETLHERNRNLLARLNLVEANAKRLGIDPEELVRPIPKPWRQQSSAGRRR